MAEKERKYKKTKECPICGKVLKTKMTWGTHFGTKHPDVEMPTWDESSGDSSFRQQGPGHQEQQTEQKEKDWWTRPWGNIVDDADDDDDWL